MSCYMRHIRDLFEALGLEYDKTNRAAVDGAIREVLGLAADEACSSVWAAIKDMPPDAREGLPAQVSERLA